MRAKTCSRRQFLRAAGAAIALPLLPSLLPAKAFAGEPVDPAKPPPRVLFLCVPLGFTTKDFYAKKYGFANDGWVPQQDGAGYALPEVHAAFAPLREDISFIKGLHHRRYRGDSHFGEDVFLTGADTFADPSRSFSNTVSCDVVAAESPLYSAGVRHRSLSLGVPYSFYATSRSGGLSWTRQGMPISPLMSPMQVFDLLFGADDLPADERRLRLQEKRSVLDATFAQQRRLAARMDEVDRRKLDEVVTAVREIEADLQSEESWIATPKPKTSLQRPDKAIAPHSARAVDAMLGLIHAAFLTDSTRVIAYHLPGMLPDAVKMPGGDKHGIVHGLTKVQAETMIMNDRSLSERVASLLGRMKDTKEADGQSLLHHTVGAYGAGGWGQWHDTTKLPVMLFGHGGGRLAQGATRSYPNTVPLANVWRTLLKAGGVEVDSFADSTGVVQELLA